MSIGETSAAKAVEVNISSLKTKYEGNGTTSLGEAELENVRDIYDHLVQSDGESSTCAIEAGLNLGSTTLF